MKIRKKASFALLSTVLGHNLAFATLPRQLDLSDLNGQNVLVFNGENANDRLGRSVSFAGDVNGDEIDDLIIGAYNADSGSESRAGKSYVVFGTEDNLPSSFDLSTLDGENGFVINGENSRDLSGYSVSSAGDFNNDGVDDLVIGAFGASIDTNLSVVSDVGKSYVIFGSKLGFPSLLELSTLNGVNGFIIIGETEEDYSGVSISSAGDVNGDEIDDLIIGAYGAGSDAGKSYVIFGSEEELTSPLNLSNLDGENGFVINGENAGDSSGLSVNSAGDVNHDGIDDIIIGAFGADPGGESSAGKSYVIFGSDDENGLPNPFNLSSLNGENGFAIHGQYDGDLSGESVSSAGDVNGDGIDDLVIGAFGADPGEVLGAGKSYVIFGSPDNIPHPFDLFDINGQNGFVINGENAFDASGHSVSSAGDINNDGIDDLIIGALGADLGTDLDVGKIYVVFGSDETFLNPFNLSDINFKCENTFLQNAFLIKGENTGDNAGTSVSSAGDFNHDGIGDLIIGAEGVNSRTGKSYVVFGRESEIISANGFDCM